jgi:DNA repair protein RadA/Sms
LIQLFRIVRAMSRTSEIYLCALCEGTAAQWVGRCPHCGEWNTLTATARRADAVAASSAVSLRLVDGGDAAPMPTGVDELDRVLGGGIVAGSVTLVFGPPGVGKSTLLFQVLATVAATGVDVVLASAEESLAQVSGRASRIGAVPERLLALAGSDVGAIEAALVGHRPALVVVDSIQSIADERLPGAAGSLAQVRGCVERLTRLAKSTGVPVVLVGHVTKDGDLAGPRTIEHLVDTVISFDGDRHHSLRILTAVKHRFGPVGEVGIFEMREDGFRAVPDPGAMLLGDRMVGVPGSVVVPVLQGRRPLLVEVQALFAPAAAGTRPHTLGIDASRVALLLAVLRCRTDVEIGGGEVFVAAVGGISITEPAVDLAVALAVASAAQGRVVPSELVAFGELGLAGEVRMAPGAERRLAEACRAGFTRALIPASTPPDAVPAGMEVEHVRTLAEALAHTGPRGIAGTMPGWSIVAASR